MIFAGGMAVVWVLVVIVGGLGGHDGVGDSSACWRFLAPGLIPAPMSCECLGGRPTVDRRLMPLPLFSAPSVRFDDVTDCASAAERMLNGGGTNGGTVIFAFFRAPPSVALRACSATRAFSSWRWDSARTFG